MLTKQKSEKAKVATKQVTHSLEFHSSSRLDCNVQWFIFGLYTYCCLAKAS